MRKNLTIFCVLMLSLFLAGSAFAINNANAYYMLDKNLATAGYQEGTTVVEEIGGSANVGFTIYAFVWDNARAYRIKFEWDAVKASFKTTGFPASSTSIVDQEGLTINGASNVTVPNEDNIFGADIAPSPATTGTGSYEITYAKTGGGPATSLAEGSLLYYAVFKTVAGFTTGDGFAVKVSVVVLDDNAVEKSLGTRYFYISAVAVKKSTWGSVKEIFKDF